MHFNVKSDENVKINVNMSWAYLPSSGYVHTVPDRFLLRFKSYSGTVWTKINVLLRCRNCSEAFPVWTEVPSVTQFPTLSFDLKRSFTNTRFCCNFCSDKSVRTWLGPFQKPIDTERSIFNSEAEQYCSGAETASKAAFLVWTEALSGTLSATLRFTVTQFPTLSFDLKRSFTNTRFCCNFCSDKSVRTWLGPFQKPIDTERSIFNSEAEQYCSGAETASKAAFLVWTEALSGTLSATLRFTIRYSVNTTSVTAALIKVEMKLNYIFCKHFGTFWARHPTPTDCCYATRTYEIRFWF